MLASAQTKGLPLLLTLVVLGAVFVAALVAQTFMVIKSVRREWPELRQSSIIVDALVNYYPKAAAAKRKGVPPLKYEEPFPPIGSALFWEFVTNKRMWVPWVLTALSIFGSVLYGAIAAATGPRYGVLDFASLLARFVVFDVFVVVKSYFSGFYIGGSAAVLVYNLAEHGRWQTLPPYSRQSPGYLVRRRSRSRIGAQSRHTHSG